MLVTIKDIAKADAFYSDKADLIGKQGDLVSEITTKHEGKLKGYEGASIEIDGFTYYFHAVKYNEN